MSSLKLLERVAVVGLVEQDPFARAPLDDPSWQALMGDVFNQRMEGLLMAAVAADLLPVSDPQFDSVRRASRIRASMDLLVERATVRTAVVLERAGIPFRLLKGPAWSHSLYPDPVQRGFGDVDILVEPGRWSDAVRALEDTGATRVFPELQPGFDERFGKDATFVAPGGFEVDLHRTLVLGAYGFWVDSEELFARSPRQVSIGTHPMDILDPDAAFVHACYNAALGDDPPRLVALRDVGQMVCAGTVDPDGAYALANGWRAAGVVRHALGMVSDRLKVPFGASPLGRRFAGRPTAWDRLILASYKGQARGYTSQLLGVVAVPGLRARVEYLAALAKPQRSYLQARGFRLSDFLRRGVRRIRQDP